jgi:hypothetical protein
LRPQISRLFGCGYAAAGISWLPNRSNFLFRLALPVSAEIAWRPDFSGAKSVKELSEQVLA